MSSLTQGSGSNKYLARLLHLFSLLSLTFTFHSQPHFHTLKTHYLSSLPRLARISIRSHHYHFNTNNNFNNFNTKHTPAKMRSSVVILSAVASGVMGVALDHAQNFDRDTMPQGYTSAYVVSQIADGKLFTSTSTPPPSPLLTLHFRPDPSSHRGCPRRYARC